MTELLERLQASLVELASRHRDAYRIAPFTVIIDPQRTDKYLSFAAPDARAGAHELAAALPEVAALFAEHDRARRTEHMEAVCPALADVVEVAGWTLSERVAVMVCRPEDAITPPAPEGLEIEPIGPDAPEQTVRDLVDVARRAFGEQRDPPNAAYIARWRERAAREQTFAGRLDGRIVGTAVALAVVDGVSEIVGVATRPEVQRRGVGTALTATAIAAAFADGAEVAFLSAADEKAGRVYEHVGFRFAGWQRGYDGPPA